MNDIGQTSAAGLLVIRQPVFDQRLQPWGTAMSFVQPEGAGSLFADELTASVLLEAYLPQRGPEHSQTIVSFDAGAVLDGVPRLMPPQGSYIEIEEAAGDTGGIPMAVAALKGAGYGIAVGGFLNRPACRAINALADVIIIDAGTPGNGNAGRLQELIGAARGFGALAQVRGMTDWRHMLHARQDGADMFQGFFFSRMNLPHSSKIVTASQISRLRLLELLDKPDADFKALARIVEADAALTYRLLRFLNSASFGLARKVDSIQQAIVLAGWKPLKNWLKIVLITDLSPSPRHQEFCYYSAQRADFLQRAARAAGLQRLVPSLSLLGLLSHLEAILEMPVAQALADVPVSDAIRLALTGGQSALSPWLALVQAMEQTDIARVQRLGTSANLTLADLARCYHESFAEADQIFRRLPAPYEGNA